MFAGGASSTPSAARTSAAPAERAGRSTSSPSSTSAAPSRTASSSACIAGDGVWWTTSSCGTRGSSPGSDERELVWGHPERRPLPRPELRPPGDDRGTDHGEPDVGRRVTDVEDDGQRLLPRREPDGE